MTSNPLGSAPDYPASPPIHGPALAGFLSILLFIGGISVWGSLAPLQGAAIAMGSVNLDTYRKTIQHFEGGIIKKILIREGQDVVEGDVLIVLDETQAEATIQRLTAKTTSQEKRIFLLNEEIADIESLLEKGLARKSRVLALHRHRAEIEGDRSESLAQLGAAVDVVRRSNIRAPISGTVVGLMVHTIGAWLSPASLWSRSFPRTSRW